MNQKSEKKTAQQMVEAIFSLDLDPIKVKLMDKTEGHGWTREQADHNELEYKRFLALLAKYPDQSIAPTTEVDKFWHGHILDTMKYAEDCDNVFGYFLHHFPYFGMRGEEDAANLVSAFMNMQRLHGQEFDDENQVISKKSAWCAAVSGGAVQAVDQKAAWCAAVSGEVIEASNQKSAWCAAVSGGAVQMADQKAAWCAAVSGEAVAASSQNSAWCAAVSGKTQQASDKENAWCGATTTGQDGSAYSQRPKLKANTKSA
jgi:hypothetical protein